MKRITMAIAIVAVASVAVYAQSARWQLVRAEYGAGNRWADVTSRVASLIRGNSLDITVSNDTLGGDPAHDRPKTLRLSVRDDSGREQILSYQEKDTISLSISTDANGFGRREDRDDRDGSRRDRGGLRILRADYGTQNHFADVTARLNSQIQNDTMNLRITNDTMGGDPADDRKKTLTVWYLYNGRAANVVVNEQDTLTLPGPNDYVSGNLRILRAQYGADYRYFDVTDRLNSQLQGDRLTLRITNDSMGGDPAHDRPKQLTVLYFFNGDQCRATVNENGTLILPGAGDCAGNSYGDGFQILQATYGAGDRRRDVTDRISALVSGNQLQVLVSNSSMGGDPAENQHKQLRVIYLWQGIRYESITPEGATLAIP
ncbi:MAG TPA: DUF3395 domain-containing protein [Candidatus Acidoferrales bacterium]|nr:DUF3395 domain-containing protein [Candidatus Acidoferrales bacterium]